MTESQLAGAGAQRFGVFSIGARVRAEYGLTADALIFRQGVRESAIGLADVRGFAVRVRPRRLGMVTSQLVVQVAQGQGTRVVWKTFDPDAPGCRALLEALRARLPGADLTTMPWAAAAARMAAPLVHWSEPAYLVRTWLGALALVGIAPIAGRAPSHAVTAADARLDRQLALIVAAVLLLLGFLLVRSGRMRAWRLAQDQRGIGDPAPAGAGARAA